MIPQLSTLPLTASKWMSFRQQVLTLTPHKFIKMQKQICKQLLAFYQYSRRLELIQRRDHQKQSKCVQGFSRTSGHSNLKESGVQIGDHTNYGRVQSEIVQQLVQEWSAIVQTIKLKVRSFSLPERSFAQLDNMLIKLKDKQNCQSCIDDLQPLNCDTLVKLGHEGYSENSYMWQIFQKYYLLETTDRKVVLKNTNQFLAWQRSIASEASMPTSLFCSIRCWKCISHFYENSELEEDQALSHRNYCIGKDMSQTMFSTGSSELLEEMICRAINYGRGFIYLGIEEVSTSGRIREGHSFNLLQQVINWRNQSKIVWKPKRYVVHGIKIEWPTSSHRKQVLKMIKKSIKNCIRPKITNVNVQAEYIPVLPHFGGLGISTVSWQQHQAYVLRIKVQFQPTQQLYYTQAENNKRNSKYTFFGEEKDVEHIQTESPDEQSRLSRNRVCGSNIYKLIHKKYSQFNQAMRGQYNSKGVDKFCGTGIRTNKNSHCPADNYPIFCSHAYSFNHEHNQKQSFSASQSNCSQQALMENHIHAEDMPYQLQQFQVYKEDHSIKHELKASTAQLKPSQPTTSSFPQLGVINSEAVVGNIPLSTHKNNSMLIVSPKGQQRELLSEYESCLRESGVSFSLCPAPYDKIPNNSPSSVYVINHREDHQLLTQLVPKIEKQQLNVIVVKVRKQIGVNSGECSQALAELCPRFRYFFNCKFGLAFREVASLKNERNYYLRFEDESQSIFAFVILEYCGIKCSFVEDAKLRGLALKYL